MWSFKKQSTKVSDFYLYGFTYSPFVIVFLNIMTFLAYIQHPPPRPEKKIEKGRGET